MERKYKILHLITRLELGGAQQNTLFCTAQHDRGRFAVELIAGRGGELDADARTISDARIQLVPYLEHPIAPFKDLLAVLRLRNYFKASGVELVHTHSSKAGVVGRLAAFLAGVPVVLHTVHGWSFNPTQSQWRRRAYVALERLAGALTDRLIVVSSRNRETGLAHGIADDSKYTVLHSGIDTEEFRAPSRDREEIRRALGFTPRHVVVGTVCCLKPQKAPLDFVRAAAMIHKADPRARFFIAGDGDLRAAVEEKIAELGLQEVVQLLGWRRDVPDLMHAMDVFLLTSLFEGLPRAVLQAMAAGVPVVATSVDGTPEVVEEGATGLLVPAGDPETAARQVLRFVEDEALRERCVRGAHQRLTEEFGIHRMVHDLERLYLEYLDPPN